MTSKNLHNPDPAIRRTDIERIIGAYPHISDDKLHAALHYIRRDASALDRATIASNDGIAAQYRQLCSDHYIDRLKPMEIGMTVAVAVILLVGLIVLSVIF